MADTPESFLERLEKSKLLTPQQLAHAQAAARDLQDPKALAKALVEQELLTRWQAAQLLAGRSSFFLGKYKLIDLLGRGGMGGVFLAEHTMMQRAVALKIIPKQLGRDPALLERFLTEARAIAALDHPNIVHAYNVDNEGDRYYLVMEFVEGQDLRRMVETDGPLDFQKAVDYTRQTADGLAHAHSRNMIHCDIKPGNLLVNRQGVVKILDLGMARLGGREENGQGEANDRVLGTVDYMAPEQALESPTLDHRVDIYALGCTLYYLLTGRPPFPEGTIPERIMKHQSQEPQSIAQLRPGVPADLVEICCKMMAKDPADRYQTAEEVSQVLAQWRPPAPKLKRAVLLEEPTPAPADAKTAPPAPSAAGAGPRLVWAKLTALLADRRRMMWFGGIGLAVLLVLGTLLTWLAVSRLSRPRPSTADATQAQAAKGAESRRAKATKASPDQGPSSRETEAASADPADAEPEPKKEHAKEPSAPRPDGKKPESDTAPQGPKPPQKQPPSKPTEKQPPEKKPPAPKPTDKPAEPTKAAEKPPPKPPVPTADPFKDFPTAVDLPDEEGELAKVLTDAAWELELVDGDKVLKGNRQFLLQRREEDGKPTWPVQVSAATAGGEPVDVAVFWREGQSLQFQWLEERPTTVANQLRLCTVNVRLESGEARSLALFRPQAAKPAELILDRTATVTQVPLAWLPDPSRLRIQITKLEGLQDYTINPAEPVPHNGKVAISFTRKDARTKTELPAPLSLLVTFGVRSPSTLTVNVRLPDKSWSARFKALSGLGVKASLEDQLNRAQKELESKGLQPARKQLLELTADDLGSKVWLADFCQAAKTARLHYQVLAEVGDKKLVEVAATQVAAVPEKPAK